MTSLLRHLAAALVLMSIALTWRGIAPGDVDTFLLSAITAALLSVGFAIRDAAAHLTAALSGHQAPATTAENLHLTRRSAR